METLGTIKKTVLKLEELHALNQGFTASADLARGQVVKFDAATGEVQPIAAKADIPFGIVTAGAKSGDRATVQVPFSAIVNSKASGAITLGADLSAAASDNTAEGVNTFIASAATETVVGVALSAASDGEYVTVGILRSFRVKA